MKLVLLIFFSLSCPLFIFLISLHFGGLTHTDIKKSLADSAIYTQSSTYIAKAFSNDSSDTTEQQFGEIIKNRVTPAYLQYKTESTIDATSAWITGKSQSTPKLSFKELKDDIVASNPDLLPAIEEAAKQAEQSANEQNADSSQNQQLDTTVSTFNNMVKSDFTFDLQKYTQGLKMFYTFTTLWLIVLGILMFASLVGIAAFASSLSAKCKWLGATMITSGLLGYGTVFVSSMLLTVGTQLLVDSTNTYLSLIKPFILAIGGQVMQHYISLQGEISIGMFLLAAVLFVLASVTKPKVSMSKPQGVINGTKAKKKNKPL